MHKRHSIGGCDNVTLHHTSVAAEIGPIRSDRAKMVCGADGDGDDADCYRFVDQVGVPVDTFLRCTRQAGHDDAFLTHSAPPPLYVDVDLFAPHSDEKLPLLLNTIARLESRSYELGKKDPSLKAEFWAQVFPSYCKGNGDMEVGIEQWMMEHDTFPRIILDLHKRKITQERLDMISTFLTARSSASPSVPGAGYELASNRRMSAFGLKFTQCELFNTHSMVLLKRFLDQVFSEPEGRNATIRSLDLSKNQMNAQQLSILVQILKKNHETYKIEDVLLGDVYFSRLRRSDEASALQALIRVVFDPSARSAVKRVSLDHTSLRVQHFAALCSSLRCGCSIEELSLVSTLNQVSGEARQECWRWLAFGLFYPRLRRFESHFKLHKVDLSRLELSVTDIEAFANTMRNPAAELVPDGCHYAENELISCIVSENSTLYATDHVTSDRIAVLKEQRVLEALFVGADWICVVVPGFGLGWVQADRVANIERERISRSQIDHLFELSLRCLSSRASVISPFLECIGRHLRFVSLKYNILDQDTIRNIRTHCVNLEHLDVEGCCVHDDDIRMLLGGSRDEFGDRLLSLNVNDNVITDEGIEMLAAALSSSEQPYLSALKELRLAYNRFSLCGLAKISNMLVVNDELVVAELEELEEFEDELLNPQRVGKRVDIDRLHQNRLLKIVMSSEQKLAFVSVLSCNSTPASARKELDACLVASILQFGGAAVRRRILWRPNSQGDY